MDKFEKNIKLSIIIITLNEESFLPILLESLKNQTFKNFEVIVADADSTDKTKEIARVYGCKITKGGIWSVGRNNGAKIAKAKYLLFLDADCILPKDFLEINFKEFKKSNKGVGTVPLKPISEKIFDRIFFKLYHYWAVLMVKKSPHCVGCGIFSRKEVFDKIGGFDENICFAENHQLSKKAKGNFIILPKEMYTSVRRLDKEGRFIFLIKYIYSGLYRLLYKEIDKPLFNYN